MEERTTIKIWLETRRKLKILAARLDKSIVQCIDDLVNDELKRHNIETSRKGGGTPKQD